MNISTELIPSEVAELLRYAIPHNVKLAEEGHLPVAYNILGEAGIAKSAVVDQVCKELSTHNYISLNLSMCEIGDITGFPYIEYKMCKGEECLWISDKLLNNYILQGYTSTSESRMSYAKPEWLVGKENKPICINLDDFSRCSPIMLNACMQLIVAQETLSWSLPKGSSVVLTSNPDDGDYMVTAADDAQKTRYITIKMKASVQDWARDYAEGRIHSSLINFLLKHPEVIEGTNTDENGNEVKKGNLRIWTKFFLSISGLCNNMSENWTKIFLLGQNAVPVEHLLMLNKFVEDKLDKLPSPEQLLLLKPEDAVKELKSVVGVGNKKRVDISSILSRRIMNFVLVKGKALDKNMLNTYAELLKSEYLSPDLVLLSLKKTTAIHPELIKDKDLVRILTT